MIVARPLAIVAIAAITSTQAQAFVCSRNDDGTGPSFAWDERAIAISPSGVGDELSDPAAIDAAVARSAATWTDVACSDFAISLGEHTDDRLVGFDYAAGVGAPRNHNILVFRNGPPDDPLEAWLNDTRYIALTTVTFEVTSGRILDADIEVNDAGMRFSTCDPVDCNVQFDFENMLTHEMGHALGLDHSEDTTATMFDSSAPTDISRRTLEQDDINGVCFVYPAGSPTAECFGVPREPPPDIRFEESCTQGGPSAAWPLVVVVAIARRFARRRGYVSARD